MKFYIKTKDHSFTQENFDLLLDQELDILITNPQPVDLNKYYESQDYISHTDANDSFFNKVYQQVKRFNLNRKLKLVGQYATGKKLLDVGAGTGDFLVVAKSQGWTVTGVEPNVKANQKAAQKGIGLNVSLDELGGNKFDVITLWHVLEHLPNLNDQISRLSNLLAEYGTLIIAVPNYKSFDAIYYKNYWAAFDVPRHLWHFSRTSISKLFQKENLEVVKIHPMIFDSFYVSLLSEKYKTGKQNFLKAFFIGLRSNLKAWSTKEYSSLIYVLKRAK